MKEEKLTSWQKILIVLILAGLIYSLFGIRELSRWNREMEHDRPRILFNTILTPLLAFSETAEIDYQAEYYKERFHKLKDLLFSELVPEAADFITSKLPGYLTHEILDPVVSWLSAGVKAGRGSETAYIRSSEIQTSSEPSSPGIPENPGEEAPENSTAVPRGESILLLGDSLANSCSTAFVPLVSRRNDLELIKYGKVSANLSNPVFDQWFEELDEVLHSREFDIIILMMGANAAQTIIDGDKRWEYGSEQWENIYRRRAENLIGKMKTKSSRIYWIGIPPMMKKNYNDNMEVHNLRISKICKETGIQYLPIESVLGDDRGRYLDYKVIDGRQVRIRTADGIHYSRAGGDILSRYILTSIFPDISLSEGS